MCIRDSVLRGKRVFLVEDSIVRSTTLRVIIGMIREKGEAKEVHVRVGCPPIMAPCSYGIDMSTVSELFAPKFLEKPVRGDISPEEISKLAADLGADSVRYLRVDALADCIGLPENDLCMGCLTGEYPTEWGNRLYKEAALTREEETPDGIVPEGRRTYERQRTTPQTPSPAPSGGSPEPDEDS